MKFKDQINAQIILVTPRMATDWLKNNNGSNRTLNINRAKIYRDIILQGKWETTHQGIAFFENGELADGQHRLKGIEMADVAVWVMVTYGIKKTAALAMDNGRVRSIHDQLRISGVGALNNTGAAILRFLLAKGEAIAPNIYQLQDYFERHTNLILFAQELSAGSVKGVTSAPVCAAIAVCSLYSSEEEARRFMTILKTGIPPEPVTERDFTVVRFRNYLIQNKSATAHGTVERKKIAMKTMRVYKAYMDNQSLSKFSEQSDFIYKIPD